MRAAFLDTLRAIQERLNERRTLRLISINSGWLIGDKLLRLLIALFIGAWVLRYLGPDQYGKFAYAIAFLALFQAFAMLGLDSIVVRNLAQDSSNANRVLGTALRLRLLASVLSLLAAECAISVLDPANSELQFLVLLIGVGMVFQTADVVDLWFQSQSQSRRTVVAKATSYVIAAGIKVSLILSNAPLWLFAAAVGGEAALSAIALYFSYKRFPAAHNWVWNAAVARNMMQQSYPLLLSSVSIIVYMKSSQLIIDNIIDSASVGIYSSAQLLSELWYFLPLTIVTSVAPVIARKKAESATAYNNALQNVFSLMWLLSISISSVVAICSGIIVTLLFGEAYRESAWILSIHIFTLVPVSIGLTQSLWLINENRSSLALYQALAGAISSIGLNLLLISKYGVIGGAIATVASQCIQAFAVSAWLAPSLFRIQTRSLLALLVSGRQAALFIRSHLASK